MFTIETRLLERHPEIFAFALHARGLNAHRVNGLDSGLEAASALAAQILSAVESFSDVPAIRTWRDAYGAAGLKPSRYRSSIESLARRAAKGPVLPVFPLVDVYNAVSLRHFVPLGAVDSERVPGSIVLRLCNPSRDRFLPLGGEPEDFPLRDSIPVYASGNEILCWCFNARDAAPTALGPGTVNAIFFTEGISQAQRAQALSAMDELGGILAGIGAEISIEPFAHSGDACRALPAASLSMIEE